MARIIPPGGPDSCYTCRHCLGLNAAWQALQCKLTKRLYSAGLAQEVKCEAFARKPAKDKGQKP